MEIKPVLFKLSLTVAYKLEEKLAKSMRVKVYKFVGSKINLFAVCFYSIPINAIL
jgi:hypothetical protein